MRVISLPDMRLLKRLMIATVLILTILALSIFVFLQQRVFGADAGQQPIGPRPAVQKLPRRLISKSVANERNEEGGDGHENDTRLPEQVAH